MSIELFKQGLEIFADQWQAPGVITLKPSADLSDYLELSTTSNRTLITAISANDNPLVLGKDATTGHSLDADDIIFGEDVEIDGVLYADGGITTGAEVGFGAAGSLTIATGAIAVTKVYHTIVVESGTGSGADQLDTATGGAEGQILIIKPATSGANDQVTVADGTGANTFILAGGANFVMDHIDDRIMFIHNGTEWVEVSRSSNS